MIELLDTLAEWFAAGEQVAVATVIRVEGSAPRPVGARMIVSTGGHMAGSVSGGCVETTVYEEMMDLLDGGPPRVLHFGITDEMTWEVGLACGGTIDVFVQTLDPALIAALGERVERGERGSRSEPRSLREPMALVCFIEGPEAGSTALVTSQGTLLGPDVEQAASVASEMLAARAERGAVRELAPGSRAFIEPFLPPPVLVVAGGVHIAVPLARFARELGFRVVVVDPRAKFANRERFPEADEVLVAWPDEALAQMQVGETTYVVLLTHDPKIDEPTLAAALKTGAAYIGAIGSRKTHADRYERMSKWGVTAEQLDRVYSPIGLDLGGSTPEETALSIIAEVVAVKNGRTGGSLRATTGPIGSRGKPTDLDGPHSEPSGPIWKGEQPSHG
ncbi:MAG: XdhC family protein [Anaerolineae bacterium]|jgi:xanthine dehydrogenase accessory factor